MKRHSMKSRDLARSASFLITREKESRDRKEIIRRRVGKGDPKGGVVFSPPGRSQECWMHGLREPGDLSEAREDSAAGQAKLDANGCTRRQALAGFDPHPAESDIRTACEGCGRFSIECRQE